MQPSQRLQDLYQSVNEFQNLVALRLKKPNIFIYVEKYFSKERELINREQIAVI